MDATEDGALVHPGMRFKTLKEMENAFKIAGGQRGITAEASPMCPGYMLVCPNWKDRCCEARLLGVLDGVDSSFCVVRCDFGHSCELSKMFSGASEEIKNGRYQRMRMGQAAQELRNKGFSVEYLEVFQMLKNNGLLNRNQGPLKENLSNEKREEMEECLELFAAEFSSLNPSAVVNHRKGCFYYKFPCYSKWLRSIQEIKLYERPGGFLILGILYDPNNEPVVQSLLLTDCPGAESVEIFVEWNKESFYIVDYDKPLVDLLESLGVDYFIKTRSLCAFFDRPGNEEADMGRCFNNLNYGTEEVLPLSPQRYLRRHCPVPLFDLNNTPIPNLYFISALLLELPFFSCLNQLISLIALEQRQRRARAADILESRLPERVTELIEEFMAKGPLNDGIEFPLDGVDEHRKRVASLCQSNKGSVPFSGFKLGCSCKCPCGKFQETLVPCVHAVKKLTELDIDPTLFVSKLYSRDNILKLELLEPVIWHSER